MLMVSLFTTSLRFGLVLPLGVLAWTTGLLLMYCLQYPNWKRLYSDLNGSLQTSLIDSGYRSSIPGDPTGNTSVKRLQLSEKIKKIEDTAKKADEDLQIYILKAVTEGLSYTQLKSKLHIPCSRDVYYDRYRRFFWLLDKTKD